MAILILLFALSTHAQQKTILFDAAHAQTAGNADWTLDEDVCGTAQRFPTPDQSGITSSTPETYWNGAFSAFGVDVVKKGFHVESLPVGARISYGDGTNAQDLSHYNVFVIPEPNIRFTAAEITAIRSFVQNGGGLFMIADHAGADRNNDGWDAAGIFNDLMGSPSIFGITYGDNSSNRTTDWFDDHPDSNYTTDTTSPIIYTGPFGSPSAGRGLGLFGSTSMTIAGNAKGHIWMTTGTHDTSTQVTFATSTYGSGRIAAVGDSSTAEDATNGCGHGTFLGYNDPSYDNGIIIANAIAWLANGGTPDTQSPTVSITAPASGATVSGTVAVNATASDNVGVTKVEFYLDGTLKSTDTTSPYSWSWDTTSSSNGSHTLTAKAYDAAGNIGTSSAIPVTVDNVVTGTDISGWVITQQNATINYTIPAGTVIPARGYVIIARQATKAAFETFWGVTLGANVVYLTTSGGTFPQINGSENYTLKNASGTVIDGPTISMASGALQDIQRKDPCLAPGLTSSWTVSSTTAANPGSGAGTGCSKGVVINEFSDASGSGNFIYEFVELFNDR
ncbi:MAG TPA: Ig-like domain-containing protein [Thermoanaerobaculia bacterium]|nr:Ig-like domain-containing protein [Thermoanaerobaculia bacterium]